MRSAFRAAVRALLDDPRLEGACDLVRLTSVVVLVKAPVTSAHVIMMQRDLAGWLGYGVSHVAHTVVPRVRASGVATCERARDAAGWTHALDFELLPLKEARAEQGLNPLSLLNKRDLATMLRFTEAVLCPGWAPKDKPATPAGFMSARQGRDSATDRLAMLLLALEAREDGSVRMAPGRLPEGYTRSEVTVARLLGCSLDAAVEVLKRLLAMGAVDWDRPERFGQDRLLIPAIRAAYQRARAASSPQPDEASGEVPGSEKEETPSSEAGSCPRCVGDAAHEELVLEGDGWEQLSFEDVPAGATDSACGDQTAGSEASSQVDAGFEGDSVAGLCADPHAAHPPVVTLSASSAGSLDCFSGSAVLGDGPLRERACAGEDRPEITLADPASSGKADPLRGEQQTASPAAGRGSAGRTRVFVRPVAIPDDLKVALAPVAWLWAGLGRESTGKWLARAVRLELVRLRGLVGDERADRRLAERLKRRLDRQGTRPVQNLAGWLLKRGLPQQAECWSTLCDDGIRMDTGGICESCTCRIGDRRGLRTVVAARVTAQHLHLPPGEWRASYESELRATVAYQAAMDLVRRERTAEQQVAFRAAVEEQKAQLALAKAERAAQPCADCGVSGAAGLCMTCTLRRETVAVVEKAVDVAVALRADVDDQQALDALTEQVTQDTWAFVRKAAVPGGCDDPTSRAYAEREVAKRVLETRRGRALERLRESKPAEAEAAHVLRMAMRGMFPTEKNLKRAKKAAAKARARVAEELLGEFLCDLYRARAAAMPQERVPAWNERCAELAVRPLAEDEVATKELVGAP
ncbi:MAG: hypothetical protein H5T76_22785 [Streptomyces sp.]|nr:hypothetical protein [Streptomyces sp.]